MLCCVQARARTPESGPVYLVLGNLTSLKLERPMVNSVVAHSWTPCHKSVTIVAKVATIDRTWFPRRNFQVTYSHTNLVFLPLLCPVWVGFGSRVLSWHDPLELSTGSGHSCRLFMVGSGVPGLPDLWFCLTPLLFRLVAERKLTHARILQPVTLYPAVCHI